MISNIRSSSSSSSSTQNSNFSIDSAQTQEMNGDLYYTIPKGTVVYRGGQLSTMPNNAFFGFNVEDVKQYGTVYAYEIREDTMVLAIMKMDNKSTLYNESDKKVKEALNKAYGMSTSEGKKRRDSQSNLDYLVVNDLCERGYSGYAINNLVKTTSGALFHGELVLCNSATKIKNPKKKMEGDAPRLERKKAKRPDNSSINSPVHVPVNTTNISYSSPMQPRSNLFGESSFESPTITKENRKNLSNMFDSAALGGRKRRTKTRRTKHKKLLRKSKKTRKQRKKRSTKKRKN